MEVKDCLRELNDRDMEPMRVSMFGMVHSHSIELVDAAMFNVVNSSVDRSIRNSIDAAMFVIPRETCNPAIRLSALRSLCQ
jgi:hypothetical protein